MDSVSRFRTPGLVLAVGAASWAWSEEGYWARFKHGDGVATWLATWLLYVALAYLCLVIIRRARVATVYGLFLAGACFGWIEEGALTGTTFADLPFSLVWTALAWHAVVTVLVGWWWLPRRLAAGARSGLAACALVGLVWGLWAVSWWGPRSTFWDTPAIAPDLPRFAAFALLVTGVCALAYLAWYRLPIRSSQLRGRVPPLLMAGAALVWFGAVIVPRVPFAPVLLLPLLGLAWWALRRCRGPGLFDGVRLGVSPRHLAPLSAVPVVATAVYAAWLPAAGTHAPRVLHGVIPGGLTLAALVLFAGSLRAGSLRSVRGRAPKKRAPHFERRASKGRTPPVGEARSHSPSGTPEWHATAAPAEPPPSPRWWRRGGGRPR